MSVQAVIDALVLLAITGVIGALIAMFVEILGRPGHGAPPVRTMAWLAGAALNFAACLLLTALTTNLGGEWVSRVGIFVYACLAAIVMVGLVVANDRRTQ